MKSLKTILAITALAALSLTAQAQYTSGIKQSTATTSLNGGTNNIAATTTNSSVAVTISCPLTTSLSIQPAFKLTASGTTAVVFKFDETIDGSTWSTATASLSITPAGTAVVTGILKPTVGGSTAFRLNTIENPNSAAITNLVVKYSVKNGL